MQQVDEQNAGDEEYDDLHPATKQLLSRRNFLGIAAGTGAAVTFLGFTVACSSTSTTASTATTAAGAASTTATTAKAAASTAPTGTAAANSLYSRLGGNPAITAVVDQFVTNVGGDARINKFFAKVNLENLKSLLVEQIGSATGGPEKYTGRDMKTTHKGLNITVADFNALVEDLSASLNQFKVPAAEQTELLTALAGMQPDIVTA